MHWSSKHEALQKLSLGWMDGRMDVKASRVRSLEFYSADIEHGEIKSEPSSSLSIE